VAKIKVGVIGLGNMGRGIATNLAKAGFSTVVWDVFPDALKRFEKMANVSVAEPAIMAAQCALIYLVVPASPEIDTLLKGKQGILANARKNLVLFDLTTSDPVYTKKLAKRSINKGVEYLDAGMSGGAPGADAGKLTLMVGGNRKSFTRTKRFSDAISEKVFFVGPSGAGHTLKLVHNMTCHANFLTLCQAGKMAEKSGIELADMIDVFNSANARSFISQERFPSHILSKKWDARSRVYNLHKDLNMAVTLGKKLKTDVSMGQGTLNFLTNAMATGMSEMDFSLLYRDFDKITKKKKSKS
jgi:3-hydroxyisobutyrate dehydrogenase